MRCFNKETIYTGNMRNACLASLCLLLWAGINEARASVASSPCPSALPSNAVQNSAPGLRKFDAAELKLMLAAALQSERIKDAGVADLTITRPWTAIEVPDTGLHLKILEMPSFLGSGQFIVRFSLSTDSQQIGTWQTAVQLKVWREIWVAASALKRGDALDKADLVFRRTDVLALREVVTELPTPLQEYELADYLAPGAAVTSKALKRKSVMRRGQTVDAVARNGAMTVTMRVEVMEEGAPGQLIRIRNPQSRRELRARVQDESTVIIPL